MRRKRYSLQTVYICIYSNKLTEGVSEPSPNSPTIPSLVVVFETKSLSLVSRSNLGSLFWGPWCYLMSTQTPSSEHQFVVWEDSLCFTLMGTFPLFDKLHFWHLTLWSHSAKRVSYKNNPHWAIYVCTWMWIMSLLPSPNQVNQLNLAETNSNLKAFLILITFWSWNANLAPVIWN